MDEPSTTSLPADDAAERAAHALIGEELLDAWVGISVSVVNERVVSLLTYNESLVCNALRQAGSIVDGGVRGLTATELCRATRMVKSQMNGILNSLESLGVITRTRSTTDRRRVEVLLDMSPEGLYHRQHDLLVEKVTRIAEYMGIERAQETIAVLDELSASADAVLSPE